ncbi:efflux RND transporter periplasmic adaptor subunit [Neptunomonas qingdaonensis]|uniref:RND family efflux transporter, MFP subunit n=1 Tax=Neptunomonas qingdaonensis TaxID=1045558 RepID=A0A1I2LT86_9GAMM|nr:efflux RND transporter periplasmic adaptor subunit [Neptunomonas qingdaonensis]SFF81848.1 RND family efflux transporter, MFP subunit [Neptunomonas qingdaonensis]
MNKGHRAIIGLVTLLSIQAGIQSTFADTLVRVKPLADVLEPTFYSAPADVVNEQHISLSAELAGVLAALHVQVGDAVLKGQDIAALECQDYRLSEAQAIQGVNALASQVTLAQQQFKRTRTLQKSGSASIELLNQRQTELSALTAQLKGQNIQVQQAQRNTSRCIVKAPFDGVITQVMTAQGAYLSVGAPLVKLLNITQAEVSARLLPQQLESMQQAVRLDFSFNRQKYPLSIRAAVPLVQQVARTQEVRLNFIQTPGLSAALSGASGEVIWESSVASIPPEYLVKRNGSLGVMLAENSVAKFIALPSAKEGQAVMLQASAEPMLSSSSDNNVLLIVQGQHVLKEGDKVEIEAEAIVSGESNNGARMEVKADAGAPAE